MKCQGFLHLGCVEVRGIIRCSTYDIVIPELRLTDLDLVDVVEFKLLK